MNVHDLQRVVASLQTHGLDRLTMRQLSVLAVLAEPTTPEKGLDFTVLQNRLGLARSNKGAVTRAIDTLTRAGIATRYRNPMDGRRVFCAITPKGREVVKSLGEAA